MEDKHTKTILIIGMHRSGTSLFSNWLSNMGLDLGADLVGGQAHSNPHGHFEDRFFLRIHRKILENNHDTFLGLKSSLPLNISNELGQKIIEYIEARNINPVWGWKEPRTTLFLDFYLKNTRNPHIIFIIRNPYEVVESLFKRGKIDFSKSNHFIKTEIKKILFSLNESEWKSKYLKSWIKYNTVINDFLKKELPFPFMVLDNNDIVNQDFKIYDYLISEWSLQLDYSPISQIVDKSLMRKNSKAISNGHLSAVAMNLYESLKEYGNL